MEKNKIRIGSRFERWVVTSEGVRNKGKSNWYYDVVCDCGNTANVRKDSLLNGQSKSCGCLASEKARERIVTHGMTGKPGWQQYYDMIRRCTDPKRKDFHHYGGRGISIDPRWLEDWDKGQGFLNFLEDMGEKPEGRTEIERFDKNGNYCKENCYWEDRKAQNNNKRSNRYLSYKGYNLTISQWAHLLNVKSQILNDRINKLKWTIEDTLEKPPIKSRKNGHNFESYRGIDFALEFLSSGEGLTDNFSLSILKRVKM